MVDNTLTNRYYLEDDAIADKFKDRPLYVTDRIFDTEVNAECPAELEGMTSGVEVAVVRKYSVFDDYINCEYALKAVDVNKLDLKDLYLTFKDNLTRYVKPQFGEYYESYNMKDCKLTMADGNTTLGSTFYSVSGLISECQFQGEQQKSLAGEGEFKVKIDRGQLRCPDNLSADTGYEIAFLSKRDIYEQSNWEWLFGSKPSIYTGSECYYEIIRIGEVDSDQCYNDECGGVLLS